MDKTTTIEPKEPAQTVLLTGGSGMIGQALTDRLLQQGYTVHHLTRNKTNRTAGVKLFLWDVEKQLIDPASIRGVDTVIHLAGEGLAKKPWTARQKEAIIRSRTDSIRLVYDLMSTHRNSIHTVISASAVGYYGDRGEELLTEDSPPGTGFLAETCIAWEQAADEVPPDVRLVKLRTGIVLQKDQGALAPLAKTVRFGVGAPLGRGTQWMPWIHLADVVKLYLFSLENPNLQGTFNMAAPHPVRNEEFTKLLAYFLKKPLWVPRVPAIALRILLGQMSTMILGSNNLSAEKVTAAGFEFTYPYLTDALKDLYGK